MAAQGKAMHAGEAVAEALRAEGVERVYDEAMLQQLAQRKSEVRDMLAANVAPHASDNPIYPGLLMQAMNNVLDDQAVVASDVGNCQMWARTFRRIATPESFMQSGVWNAMSNGLPTATEYGANILIVVLNDGAFGQTYMQQTNIYGHAYGTAFKSPQFADIATACGAKGMRVTAPRDVESALQQGLAATKTQPALVEVMVARHAYPKI